MVTPVPIPNTAVKHPGPMVVPTGARVGDRREFVYARRPKVAGHFLLRLAVPFQPGQPFDCRHRGQSSATLPPCPRSEKALLRRSTTVILITLAGHLFNYICSNNLYRIAKMIMTLS